MDRRSDVATSASDRRSQFETATSSGGLTAKPGGDRWRWESSIFGGVYDDASPRDRPKYGALNFRAYLAGAAPRFGSAHFRLAALTLERTTFCYPDSVFDPSRFGVVTRMSLLELALADDQDLQDYRGPEFVARFGRPMVETGG